MIADAIASGQQPPTLQGLYGNTVHVRAELAKRGYVLRTARNRRRTGDDEAVAELGTALS